MSKPQRKQNGQELGFTNTQSTVFKNMPETVDSEIITIENDTKTNTVEQLPECKEQF
jgi:hypothetical protein